MTTIGVDPARHTGWAVVSGREVIESGVWEIAGDGWTKDPSAYNVAGSTLCEYLTHRAARFPRVPIVCEDPTTRHTGIAKAYGALLSGVVGATILTAHDLEFVKPTVWRKQLFDKGNATKTDSIETAAKLLGREPVSDDEADAVCIALYGEMKREGAER